VRQRAGQVRAPECTQGLRRGASSGPVKFAFCASRLRPANPSRPTMLPTSASAERLHSGTRQIATDTDEKLRSTPVTRKGLIGVCVWSQTQAPALLPTLIAGIPARGSRNPVEWPVRICYKWVGWAVGSADDRRGSDSNVPTPGSGEELGLYPFGGSAWWMQLEEAARAEVRMPFARAKRMGPIQVALRRNREKEVCTPVLDGRRRSMVPQAISLEWPGLWGSRQMQNLYR